MNDSSKWKNKRSWSRWHKKNKRSQSRFSNNQRKQSVIIMKLLKKKQARALLVKESTKLKQFIKKTHHFS
jgi:hypothetical protein